jgi:hypothetical protein
MQYNPGIVSFLRVFITDRERERERERERDVWRVEEMMYASLPPFKLLPTKPARS